MKDTHRVANFGLFVVGLIAFGGASLTLEVRREILINRSVGHQLIQQNADARQDRAKILDRLDNLERGR